MKLKTQKIDDDVDSALRGGNWTEAGFVLPEGLDRDLYLRTNKALEALGGKWSRKAKAHVFEGPAKKALLDLLSAGVYVDEKKSFDVFYTPTWLADELVQYLPWSAKERPEARFLEPSAGSGALVHAIRRAFPEGWIEAVEIRSEDDELEAAGADSIIMKDFMNWAAPRRFDAVVMNPPFSGRQDIDHVMRAWQFLKEGGALVAVMSRGSKTADSTQKGKDFLAWVKEIGAEWNDLPDDAFKTSGTLVRTSALIAVK